MNFFPNYLAGRALFRIKEFFVHWYVNGSRRIGHAAMTTFENLDRSFAFVITLKFLFQPLYGDYSPVGRIVGPIFRLGRLLIGGVIYLIVGTAYAAFYAAWVLFPVALAVYIVKGALGL
ncbi:hypothetical protein D6833_03905 [Candidatus Parcubacteria bacterium]|nr:MAG: hypothetical protein D6833_03905 [Candidatus Parcubacteria bacterium]